ncbi:MAG: PAS domain S-box protein [Desulfarculus sp.]|nr:PAS domain S-box protein [Pseudomonadota bacterium]MBV1714672.1 PAS domain S-box protein [Desulfarculus sp.]MBU4573085.1 PAS domain S-box protein [Pseudomonadota bacterium]MBU4600008.1 PAS domain S-box protein [Pseudomonadota bacterium]MBV1740209.1 PAS domain S-box protein [Desulfarculus sp.]
MTYPERIFFLGLPPKLEREARSRLCPNDSDRVLLSTNDVLEIKENLTQQPDFLLVYAAKPEDASQALAMLQQQSPYFPTIVIDPHPSMEKAMELLRAGAADYLGLNQLDRLEAAAVMAVNRRISRTQMLSASEKRYRTLVETMKDGLVAIDNQRRITFINPSLCSLMGYSEQELLGQDIQIFFDPTNKAVLEHHLSRRRKGISTSYDVEVVTKGGSRIPILISASPLIDPEGKLLGSMAIYTDLRALRRMEGEVRQAASEWRQCFDALEDMVVVISNDCKVQRCNKALTRYLGLDFADIVNQPYYHLMYGKNQPPLDCLQHEVITTGKATVKDFIDPKTDRIFSLTVSPISADDGKVMGSVHLYRDITEHRRQEQERMNLSRAITEGLEATTMALTNMVDSRDPYTSGHSQRVAELAVKVATHMGLSSDELEGIKFCGLLHDIGKGAIPLDILNRPGRLTEHEQGIIREHPTTAYRILENIPFPWPVARVVYEHHERLDGSGYPQGLTGEQTHPWAKLLAVCDVVEAMTSHRPYRPAHSMHDAFTVLREGAGSQYDSEIVKAALEALGSDDRRVTVVDDDQGVLGVYTSFLKRAGMEVFSYNDPKLALEAYEQDPTPTLVTDLKMPGLSGLDVLKAVKKIKPNAEVIVVTGHGDKESVVAAMRMGASDYLEKPVQMAELQQAVERARRRYSQGS